MPRYDNNKVLYDKDSQHRYLSRIKYPVIPIKDSDILIIARFSHSYILLAQEHYGDVGLWWIIARANNQNNGSVFPEIGKKIRIPTEIDEILDSLYSNGG